MLETKMYRSMLFQGFKNYYNLINNIEFSGGEITATGTSGHEDLTIREEGGGVNTACRRNGSGGRTQAY